MEWFCPQIWNQIPQTLEIIGSPAFSRNQKSTKPSGMKTEVGNIFLVASGNNQTHKTEHWGSDQAFFIVISTLNQAQVCSG